MTAAQFAAEQRQPAVPDQMQAAYADYLKSPNPQGLPFQYAPKPEGRLGVGQTEAEKASALLPVTREADYQKGVDSQNLKWREKILVDGDDARKQKINVARLMQLNSDPAVASGALAETISGFKNVADSFGLKIEGVAAEQAITSIASEMSMQLRNPESGGGLPGAVSDRDLSFLKSMPPNLAKTKEGRELIAETYNAIIDRKLQVERMAMEHEEAGGKIDNQFRKKVAEFARANPLLEDAKAKAAQELSKAPKVTGATRQYHIQNILKNGSEDDKRKLRERGLLP